MIVIGEKINGSIPSVAEAIAKRDADFIKQRAIAQTEAGATFIDCCASVPEAEEVETLKWMIECIQEVTDLPISVDSPSPDVLIEAYKFCNKPGIFNSVSGEGDKIVLRQLQIGLQNLFFQCFEHSVLPFLRCQRIISVRLMMWF